MKHESESNQTKDSSLVFSPNQRVLLIAGPAGSGKTSMGRRIAQIDGWYHLPEDRVWDELPRTPHTPRTDAEKAIVQGRAVSYIVEQLREGMSVVVDFILYEDPPQPILFYQAELTRLGVPVFTKVLRPSVDEILARQSVRANTHDTEVPLSDRRRYAENEVRCLSSEYIDASWIVDSTNSSIEEVFRKFFADIVETDGSQSDK